jgi:NTE family protein
MQDNLAQMKLAAHRPDLLIELPRNACAAYEFYRAREIIELGRERARTAIASWPRAAGRPRGADSPVTTP